MVFSVYILQSEKDKSFYVGVSSNPEERLEKHNRPHKGYTARKQPWVLLYTEAYATKTEALKRENYIKSQKSREFIENLISGSSAG
ncbi:GIY-YIG nuclease family protein [Mongoliitalea daihaiensis]|uniref:GIY-YIG nuclease family protein n=1 Tax=Mongoliitalea daihaiensis TaxID=2782006 RepID=UPI001F24AF76|nr:GIY-YIG nuclease family protein [Mongoliitalea daihaiensis]UJP63855.1 GIY-YIG nuclease family protein [Mongoliitalea daihaiensis]